MKVYSTRAEWLSARHGSSASQTLGFVPTMGALHEGHLTLLRASKAKTDRTVLSIFVNPTQFNQAEDFDQYPRTLERDLELARSVGVDEVFAPTNPLELYPQGDDFRILETRDSKLLEGAFRPGHFEGMLTVVLKLLQVVRPTHAFFGEKDYQQLILVQKMARDFFLGTEVVPVPTVREASGLAMSSRNTRLSPQDREKASEIYRALTRFKDASIAAQALQTSGFQVEYCEDHWGRRLFAGWLSGIRLIDNVPLVAIQGDSK